MKRQKGQYQKRKERQNKLMSIIGIVAILFVTLILIWFIVNSAVAIRDIRNNALEEYTGTYSYELKRTYGKNPHYYYLITLDNGDVLSISKDENKQIIEGQGLLTFQYSKNVRRAIFSGAYPILSMESSDGDVVLLSLENSHSVYIRNIWIFSVLLFIWFLLFGGLLLLYYFGYVYDKWIVKRRKTNEKKRKEQT